MFEGEEVRTIRAMLIQLAINTQAFSWWRFTNARAGIDW